MAPTRRIGRFPHGGVLYFQNRKERNDGPRKNQISLNFMGFFGAFRCPLVSNQSRPQNS